MPPRPILIAICLVVVLVPIRYYAALHGPAGPNPPVVEFMPVLVSIVLLISALFVILSKKYAPADRHWAYGSIGTIVGYWLHNS
jgi:uncharacterized membrane protein SirB2